MDEQTDVRSNAAPEAMSSRPWLLVEQQRAAWRFDVEEVVSGWAT